jgi:integrase
MSIRKREWQSKGEIKTAWVVDYVDQHGKRRLKTFRREKDAKDWAVTALHEVASGTHAPDSKATVADVYELWLKHCINEGRERSTVEQRQRHLKLHTAPFIGRIKLAELTTPRVHRFMDALRDAGRSVAMRRKVLTSLSTALTFAKGRGLVAQNVAVGVKVASDARHRATGPLRAGRDFPGKPELKALMDNAPERWRAFIVVAVFTGLRASELRGLRWCDIDLENAVLSVTQRADTWGRMSSPKSAAGRRDVPLTPMVANALRQHRRASTRDSELVFTTSNGGCIAYSNFHTYAWRPLLDACGLDFEFHSLRHAAASLFIEQLGWPPKRIMAVMGHSSIQMTFNTYGHMFDQGDVSADMAKLQAAIVAA